MRALQLRPVCWTTLAEDNAARAFSVGFYTSVHKSLLQERRGARQRDRECCPSCGDLEGLTSGGGPQSLVEEAFKAG